MTMIHTLKSLAQRTRLGRQALQFAHLARSAGRRMPSRSCPMCGFVGPLAPSGFPVRPDAMCPDCQSLERHRLFALWLGDHRAELASKTILHFAPEAAIQPMLAELSDRYETCDIAQGRAQTVINIEAIDRPDATYDAVVCFHVLEHVDDMAALAELYRVLRRGGVALLQIPIVEGWDATYENAAVTSDADRDLHFGQPDHIRYYGSDVRDRIRAAGFELSEFTAIEPFVHRHGLLRGEKLFIARKT